MPSSSVAEWILARFIDRNRASSIVGDLVETGQHRGDFWFWYSLSGVVVAATWRRLAGYLAGSCLALYWMRLLDSSIHSVNASHQPVQNEAAVLSVLQVLVAFLWINATYSSVRFGFRDPFAQLALAYSAVVSACVYYWWLPAVTVPCLVLISLISLLCVLTAKRRAFIALTAAVCLGLAGVPPMLYLGSVLHRHDQNASLLIYLVTLVMDLIQSLIAVAACSLMHRALLERDRSSLDAEPAS